MYRTRLRIRTGGKGPDGRRSVRRAPAHLSPVLPAAGEPHPVRGRGRQTGR